MGWRDQYQAASFRGVPFYVERAESEFGRRTQLHIFPNKDLPYSEDLGRRPREYSLDGYLLGDDFYAQKDKFVEAIEAPGPGQLIHPYYGVLLVSCTSCRFTDTNKELGIARMSLAFQESGEAIEPVVRINSRSFTNSVKISGLSAAYSAFLRAYSVINKPLSEVNKVIAATQSVANIASTARRAVADVASYRRLLTGLTSRAMELAQNPAELATQTQNALVFGTFPFIGEVRTSVDNAKQMLNEMRAFFNGTPDISPDPLSPVSVLNDYIKTTATITAAGLIVESPFETIDSLKESAQIVYAQIDAVEDSGFDDSDTLASFRALRVAIRSNIKERADSLPQLRDLLLPESVPAIVLSNTLYGNVDRENDILRRNGLDHPGFLPGASSIKVLTNV